MRKKFKYRVHLQPEVGDPITHDIECFWYPSDESKIAAGEAAYAENRLAVKNQIDFAVLAVEVI